MIVIVRSAMTVQKSQMYAGILTSPACSVDPYPVNMIFTARPPPKAARANAPIIKSTGKLLFTNCNTN